jgi:hypothetical protein
MAKQPSTPKTKKAKQPRVLYTLSSEELEEYKTRHGYMVFKHMELAAASNYVEVFQNALIEEHGLPITFDLNLETGKVTEREAPEEVTENAENGRV